MKNAPLRGFLILLIPEFNLAGSGYFGISSWWRLLYHLQRLVTERWVAAGIEQTIYS